MRKLKFLNDHLPKADGVTTLEKKMRTTLLLPFAKRAKTSGLPTPLGEAFHRSDSILGCQPSEELCLWRRPSLPNHVLHGGEN